MAKKEDNLKPGEYKLTLEEQKKGGVASGEARRKKRDLRNALEALLDREFKGKDGNSMTGAEWLALKQFEKAMKGDTRAFETVRDTAGQKPVDKIMVAEVEQETIDEIEALVASYDERHGG